MSMITVRLDEGLKEQATEALDRMGLSLSDAVRIFLTRVAAEQAIPFAVKVPNAVTRKAMAEARAIGRGKFSGEADLDLEFPT